MELSVLYWTTKLITLLTTAGQLLLSWKRKTQTPFKFSYHIKPIIISHFHLRLFFVMENFSHPPTWHELGSNQILWFDEHNMTEETNFQPTLLLFGRIQIDTGILHIHSCCNINRYFKLTIQCPYDLQEGKISLPLITLLSGCCDGDDLGLLWSGKFVWMIHDPCVNWICNMMESTHLQTYTEISLYTQQIVTCFGQPCDHICGRKMAEIFVCIKKKFYLYIGRCQCCK